MHAVGLARMPADAHHDSSPTRAVMMTVASCHARQAARRVACSILACVLGAAGVPYVAAAAPTPEQITFFESKIRPVLVEHCYQCHSAEALRSGRLKANLQVDSREGMHKGGESGAAVVPGRRDESLLLAAIRYDGFEMPPTGRLPDTVIADFETWIDMGAPDPRDEPAASTEERTIDVEAGRRHWSYRRLAPVSPPRVEHDAWPRNDIDRFILARQESAGIAPNEEAAKETLLRRVTFDLTGLPPTVEELEAFLADTSGDAYDRVVDRLLASPRHGERWARHWLDAVRYGESGGYEFDGDRPGAHHYRDWVIKALNADMPYDEFLRMQVAGDLLEPGNYDATAATGFLVAGPYPGQVTAKTVEPIRYDQLDDMAQALGASVLGMTIGCARCHDHKYDPIGHRDYYALIACLGKAVQREVDIDPDPSTTKRNRDAWLAERAPVSAAADRFEVEVLPTRLARWLAVEAPVQQAAAWLVLEPQTMKASSATLAREADDAVVASGKLQANDTYTLTFTTHQRDLAGLRLEALARDRSDGKEPIVGPGISPEGGFRLSTVKVTAAPLVAGPGRAAVTPKLSAVAASFEDPGAELAKAVDADAATGWSTSGRPGASQSAILAFDAPVGFEGGTMLTVELKFEGTAHGFAAVRIAASAEPAAAGLAGRAAPQAAREVATLVDAARGSGTDATATRAPDLLRWFSRLDAEAAGVYAALATVDAKEPKPNLLRVYSATNGAWVISGNSQGVKSGSEDVFVLARGEVNRKKGKAAAGFVLATVADDEAERQWLAASGDAPPPDPRLGLATILTDVPRGAGPLAARVIVNRLWHHHFGRGIVGTPNDLGTQGDAPTHPELLEWLANRLVEDGWRLKSIHRLIVTSAAYRQAGTVDAARLAKDPDNALLWHRRPSRLEGEAIRDAVLAVAGILDLSMYGRAGLDANSRRRSVYLNVKRSQPVGFLQVFDQPEPLQPVGARAAATVPTQALALMNSQLVRTAAEQLANRARAALSIPPRAPAGAAAVELCFRTALSRAPSPAERDTFTDLLETRERAAGDDQTLRQAALADTCHLILCLNEFVYVD
ncbi:MAG: DUF1549 domain-containing protein [Planctomycetia bacterium]|nr:DUF1549 domain-containing protein [Planctomycetia bacterium]